jgi:hypothetical protein
MITQEQFKELTDAMDEYLAAEVRVRQICARLGGDGAPSSARIALGAQVAKPAGRRGSARRAAGSKPAGRGRGRGLPTGKKAWRPKIQVRCSTCDRIIKGAVQIGAEFFPYGHSNDTGPCGGKDVAGTRVDRAKDTDEGES